MSSKEKADAVRKLCEDIQDLNTTGAQTAMCLKDKLYRAIVNDLHVHNSMTLVDDVELPVTKLLAKVGELRKLLQTL